MDLHLKDKVILVTGGAGKSGSIGAAITKAIAGEGGIPAIIDKSERGWTLLEEIADSGKSGSFVRADLSNEFEIKSGIEKIIGELGRIDGLVNNVGINDGIGWEKGADDFMDSLRLNLLSYWLSVKYSLSELRKARGSIVNIASKVAVTGQGGTSAYAAAKGGVLALTREWAVDLIEDGIRVNAVVPSEVWTPSYKEWIEGIPDGDEKLIQIQSRIPLHGRMTTPEEIASSVLYLLSDQSSHTTGQWMFVDGGYVHLDRSLLTQTRF